MSDALPAPIADLFGAKYRTARVFGLGWELSFGEGFSSRARLSRSNPWAEKLAEHDVFRFMERCDVRQARKRFVVISLAEGVDDWSLPFEALVVQRAKPHAVFLFGHVTAGRLEPVAASLAAFKRSHLRWPEDEDPQAAVTKVAKRAKQLDTRKQFEVLVELVEPIVSRYGEASLRDLAVLRGRLGRALLQVGRASDAAKELSRAWEGGDHSAFLPLLDTLCFRLERFEEARRLARLRIAGADVRFAKIRIDGIASAKLGDDRQAANCYRILLRDYASEDASRVNAVRAELSAVSSKLASMLDEVERAAASGSS